VVSQHLSNYQNPWDKIITFLVLDLFITVNTTIGYNVIKFYNDMFRLTRVIVRLRSEPLVLTVLLLTVLEVVDRYEVVAVLTLI
jgi:hypothetical protein